MLRGLTGAVVEDDAKQDLFTMAGEKANRTHTHTKSIASLLIMWRGFIGTGLTVF